MAIVYGLTDQGFVRKPLTVIRDEMNTAFRNVFGQSIDLSDRSILGILIGIFAERISQVWELLEVITTAQDPNKATGTLLDALCALTGTLRLAAASSTVTLTFVGLDGTSVASGTRVLTASTSKAFATTADAQLALQAPWRPLTSYAVDARVTSAGSVYQCTVAGTSAGGGGPSSTDPAADIVDGAAHWTFLGVGEATGDADAASVELGPVVGVARDITQIANPIFGLRSVVNLASAVPGRLDATDEDLRHLRELELSNAGSTPLDAIRAALLQVPGVAAVTLFANNADTTNSDGVPPHSVESLIQGGADQDVYDRLLASVAAGIGTFGTRAGVSVDSQGTPQPERFSRPTEVPIYVAYTLTVDPAAYPADGARQVQNALATFGAAQSTGRDAVRAAISAQAFQVDGVLDVPQVLVFNDAIGAPTVWAPSRAYVASPGARSVVTIDARTYICIAAGTSAASGGPAGTGTDLVDGSAHWCFLGNNVGITSRQIATFAPANIAVTSISGTP